MNPERKNLVRNLAVIILAGFLVVPAILARTSPFNAPLFGGSAGPVASPGEAVAAAKDLAALAKRLPAKLALTRRAEKLASNAAPNDPAETNTNAAANSDAAASDATPAAVGQSAGADATNANPAAPANGDPADAEAPATGTAAPGDNANITPNEAAAAAGASYGFWKLAWTKAAPFLKTVAGKVWGWLADAWRGLTRARTDLTESVNSGAGPDALDQLINSQEATGAASP